jgi:hypothetical protein
MEVTLLALTASKNTPRKPVIAFKAGTSLRHAEMRLNKAFRVPLHGDEDGSIKVSLFQQLGTQTIPDADESESVCNVPIRCPDGKCSQVKLRVRRGQQSAFPGKYSAGAEEYLNEHQLEARIQGLFETVLKKQPENPYRCMIQELQKVRAAGRGSDVDVSEIIHKVPMAPSEPRPANARPAGGIVRKKSKDLHPEQENLDTKAALAEIRDHPEAVDCSVEERRKEAVKQASRTGGAEAVSNLELAHEVMRMAVKGVVTNVHQQSTALGIDGTDSHWKLKEHSKNAQISFPVRREAYQAALQRMQARSIGLCAGGHTPSDYIVPVRNKDERAMHKALTASVDKSLYNKAYWSMDV